MAAHKNQHFVPRCYLKGFSSQKGRKTINLLNIQGNISVQNAAIKNQCSASYFYGTDLRAETALQAIEGHYANLVHRLSLGSINISEEDKFLLKSFMYLQYCRTEAAAKRAVLMASEIVDLIDPVIKQDWQATTQDAIRWGLLAFAETSFAIHDLKVCIVYNDTKEQFITSDDPVVSTNRWYLQNTRARGLTPGFLNAGAIVILPLTAQLLCILYDGDVYSIVNSGSFVTVTNPEDVWALNEHQLLNCNVNLYFHDWSILDRLKANFQNIQRKRLKSRHKINVAVLDHVDDRRSVYKSVKVSKLDRNVDSFLHSQTLLPTPSKWPRFITYRSKHRVYSNGSGAGYVRHAEFIRRNLSQQGFKKI